MKYVIVAAMKMEWAIVFPDFVTHASVVSAEVKPIAAGFFSLQDSTVRVHGRSSSLNLCSREQDAGIIARSLAVGHLLPMTTEMVEQIYLSVAEPVKRKWRDAIHVAESEHAERALTIDEQYATKCATPSDIYQHLPTLWRYASQCESVTEFGVRGIVSTWALLAGRPKTLLSVDPIDPVHSGGNLALVESAARAAGIEFRFQQADDREIEIGRTDLLFIDTWHVYEQLKAELELHADKVNRFIILHDTVTFAESGETPGHRGLMPAVGEFLLSDEGKNWRIREHFTNCNGLTVLERTCPKIK